MSRIGGHHGGVRPAQGPFLRHGRSNREFRALQEIDLRGPGTRGYDAFVLEIIGSGGRIASIARDAFALAARQVKGWGIMLRGQVVGVGDAQIGVVHHQVKGCAGDLDRSGKGLHIPDIALPSGRLRSFEDHAPTGGGLRRKGAGWPW